jgi:chemotaxis protein methyltransferase CheR
MSIEGSATKAKECVMRAHEFETIRKMAYEFCGVDLDGKQVLVSARLGKKVRELGLPSFDAYIDYVRKDSDAFTLMIDALTTNHTSFFREMKHYEFLHQTVLPNLAPNSKLNFWSAACSSGEEPYTIAFSMMQAWGDSMLSRVSITATDISTRVLQKAKRGMYPASTLTSVPPDLMKKCLLKGTGKYVGECLVKPEIRNLVEFRQLNLLKDVSSVGPFEVIFCRNVMIYFDIPTQQTVVDNLVSRLAPGGYLFIGHAESLNGIRHSLKYIRSAIFRKPGGRGDTGSK